MSIEHFETILIFIIVSIQLYVFFTTFRQIRLFREIVPKTEKLKIFDTLIKDKNENIVGKIPLIKAEGHQNDIFDKILYSINTYLYRNQTNTADFNLIKDITERNADTIEEEINLTISVPLYLGLMGTMLGIVIALFSMSDMSLNFVDSSSTDKLGEGINVLLRGVKIAMIASFTGLLLTTINSGWFFKGSKNIVENYKNDFYTFIQTELLPTVNQSLEQTFESLQRNLAKFNNDLRVNLGDLSKLFKDNLEALSVQQKILEKIEKIDVAKVANYNLMVFKELKESSEELEKLTANFENINVVVANSATLVDRINSVLERTDNMKEIVGNMNQRLSESEKLMLFLTTHFEDLEQHKQKTSDSIADVGLFMKDVYKDLREHIEKSSESIYEFTNKELDLLEEKLEKSRTSLENLKYLETLNNDVAALKEITSIQSRSIHGIEKSNDSIYQSTIEELSLLSKKFAKNESSLSNLELLKALNSDVSDLKSTNFSQREIIQEILKQLSKKSSKSVDRGKEIERTSHLVHVRNGNKVANYFRRLLRLNKNKKDQE